MSERGRPDPTATPSQDGQAPGRRAEGPTILPRDEAREASLRAELEGIQRINHVVDGVVSSLERATENMEVVSRTVASASALLNTWIRILSQTEHNQRLILHPGWRGASQDLADLESEKARRRQAAERREMEEQQQHRQRQEAAARSIEAEPDERRRVDTALQRGGRGSRGRRSAFGRGGGSTTGLRHGGGTGRSARASGPVSRAPTRSSSGIGRGLGRGRTRSHGHPAGE